jgi:hypothetical protein
LPTSPPIGEPLASDTCSGFDKTLIVIHAKTYPLVIPEIEFSEVALQMLLAYVVINANNPAFRIEK